MKGKNQSAENPCIPSAGDLLGRMRDGDRSACGLFMLHYGDLVRLRIRDKLSVPLRRVLDSEDVLATVTRRLDRIVCDEKLRAETDSQLWALVMQIAKNVIRENVRTRTREPGVSSDAELIKRLAAAASDTPAVDRQAATEWAFRVVDDEIDRLIIQRRIAGDSHDRIAALVDLKPSAVRMRWSRVIGMLQETAGGEQR